MPVRFLKASTNLRQLIGFSVAAAAVLTLTSYAPAPSLIDQIKILGELRVVTRGWPPVLPALGRRPGAGPGVRPCAALRRRARRAARHYPGQELRRDLRRAEHRPRARGRGGPQGAGSTHRGRDLRSHVPAGARAPHLPARLDPTGIARRHPDGDLEIAAGSSHAKALRTARDSIPDLAWVENGSCRFADAAQGRRRRQHRLHHRRLDRVRARARRIIRTCASRSTSRAPVARLGGRATATSNSPPRSAASSPA